MADAEGAVRVGSEMLEEDPEFLPAHVLIAQVEFADGQDRRVIERLLPGDALRPRWSSGSALVSNRTAVKSLTPSAL